MKYQAYDKYEYKYLKLAISIQKSVDILNTEGAEGWELIKMIDPASGVFGGVYRALLKRKIIEIEV